MTLNEFYNKHKNGVDYDGAYGKQCVDYVNAYAKEVLGIGGAFVGPQYAYQCYTQYASLPNIKNNFERIANTPTNFPKAYDVIVWSKERNGYAGHIAIVTEATVNSITVLEQNYDKRGGVRKYTYDNYKNVLGWLRPKKLPQSKPAPVKKNKPKITKGQEIKLKARAKLYHYDSAKSGVIKIKDISQYDINEECVLKAGAKVKADKISTKANGNIWIYSAHYKAWICVYSYKDDYSKV